MRTMGYEVYECALDVWYSLSHEYQCHSFFKRIYSGMFVVLVERTNDFEILSVEQLIKYLDGSRPYPISFIHSYWFCSLLKIKPSLSGLYCPKLGM